MVSAARQGLAMAQVASTKQGHFSIFSHICRRFWPLEASTLPPALATHGARRGQPLEDSGEIDIMDDSKALGIVSALANGVNPLTGEVFDIDSPYQTADVIRALYAAVRALETAARSKTRVRTRLPANAGKPWSEQEDRDLLEKFDEGSSVAELAHAHDRTIAGIQARLERHGRLQGQGLQWRGRNGQALAQSGAASPHGDR
jgi:hypothetical protein